MGKQASKRPLTLAKVPAGRGMSRRLAAFGTALGMSLQLAYSRALAHGFDGADEERLNVGLVLLSFALIGAFVYITTLKRGRPGGDEL